jgi:hypothetical protein
MRRCWVIRREASASRETCTAWWTRRTGRYGAPSPQATKLQRKAMQVPLREDYKGEMKARLEKYEKAARGR